MNGSNSNGDGTIARNMIEGSLAGMIATAPMTWVMRAAEPLVPEPSRLPPRQITERLLDDAGVKRRMNEDERKLATLVAHYGFGTGAGCLLGLVAPRTGSFPRPLTGAAVGAAVWAASYMGWLPALRIRRHAANEPAARNLQMIAAHLVWGWVAGAMLDRLNADEK